MAQAESELIFRKTTFNSHFEQDSGLVRLRDVKKLMAPYPEAAAEFKKAKSNYDAGTVFSLAGGFLVGWPLGEQIGGGEPNWNMAAAGVVLLVPAVLLHRTYLKHARKSADLYNQKAKSSSARLRPNVQVLLNPFKAGVVLKF
jgi:hypothetical protein